jgi:hypothetical protein
MHHGPKVKHRDKKADRHCSCYCVSKLLVYAQFSLHHETSSSHGGDTTTEYADAHVLKCLLHSLLPRFSSRVLVLSSQVNNVVD